MKTWDVTRGWSVSLLVAFVSACGVVGDSSGPSDPLAPNVAGRYSDPRLWTIELLRVRDGHEIFAHCSGYSYINQNTGASALGQLTGSVGVGDPCRPFAFDMTGTVWSDGRLELTTNAPPAPGMACSPAVAVQFRGQINQAHLKAQGEATLRCPGGENYAATYTIEAARKST